VTKDDLRPLFHCSGKLPHTTRAKADAELEWMKQRYARGRSSLHVYKCTVCGHYHVGHAPKQENT
jgi:rubrerythrin